MIHYLEGIGHLLLADPCLSSIYDNLEPEGQWRLTQDGPELTNEKYRIVIPILDLTPQGFRKELVAFLVHVAHQSEVPEVPGHRVPGSLKTRLPKVRPGFDGKASGYPRLYSMLLNIRTWFDLRATSIRTEKGLVRPRPSLEWRRFGEHIEEVRHVVFDDGVPDGLVLGLTVPEDAGTIIYGDSGGFVAGARAVEHGIKAVRTLPECKPNHG